MKRHPLVDSLGLVINVVTHAANIHDSVGVKQVFEKVGLKKLNMSPTIANTTEKIKV